jgi:hypothetical protein
VYPLALKVPGVSLSTGLGRADRGLFRRRVEGAGFAWWCCAARLFSGRRSAKSSIDRTSVDARAKMQAGRSACIDCPNCLVTCRAGAIRLAGDLDRARGFMRRAIESQGHKEQPETAVYPIRRQQRGR